MIFLGSVFEVEGNHQEDILNFEDRSASRQFSVLRGSVQKGNVFRVVGEGNYRKEPDSYFEARTLNKIKGSYHLWGLAISTISCGIFESWNIYLDGQGWGSLLVSTVVVFIMYLCLTSCISELSCALPQTGGAYSFARTALGSIGGFITGLTQTIEFVLGVSLSGLFVAINANKTTRTEMFSHNGSLGCAGHSTYFCFVQPPVVVFVIYYLEELLEPEPVGVASGVGVRRSSPSAIRRQAFSAYPSR